MRAVIYSGQRLRLRCIVLSEAEVDTIFQEVEAAPGYAFTIDMPYQVVGKPDGQ
jgi:3-isopropylmalate/(R)-2-methylmalate dehydratase small subunit